MKTAVVLAGGLGTRLRPLTHKMPKALIPIRDTTLTDHVLGLLKAHGIETVYLAIGYLAEQIQEHFGDGNALGLKIKYVVEDEPLGTGGWMHLVDPADFTQDFIVLNGDNLFDLDFDAMLELHQKENALVTIGLSTVEDVEFYGVAELDGNKILRFVEKPKREEAPSKLINGGYYLFSPDVFAHIPKDKKFMFETDLFPKLAEMGKLCGYPSDGQWFDTGTPERWKKAEHEWKVTS